MQTSHETERKHTKLDDVTYSELKIQPYLTYCKFSKEERKHLISLRSQCHSAKPNYRKLNKGNLGMLENMGLIFVSITAQTAT